MECNHNNFVIKSINGQHYCLQCHKVVVLVEIEDVTDDGTGAIIEDIKRWKLELTPAA
jgi:hypothetical protein